MDLLLHGAAIGLDSLTGLEFDPGRDHTYCCICGEIFQSDADRNPVGVYQKQPADFNYRLEHVTLFALGLRKEWSAKHAKRHPEHVHRSLKLSGRHYTPEAAHRLAAFGVISVKDLVLDDEVSDALRLSSPVPVDDVEGT